MKNAYRAYEEISSFNPNSLNGFKRLHGNSNAFIEFMLDKINETPDLVLEQAHSAAGYPSEYVRWLLDMMEYDTPYAATRIMSLIHPKSKET